MSAVRLVTDRKRTYCSFSSLHSQKPTCLFGGGLAELCQDRTLAGSYKKAPRYDLLR